MERSHDQLCGVINSYLIALQNDDVGINSLVTGPPLSVQTCVQLAVCTVPKKRYFTLASSKNRLLSREKDSSPIKPTGY
jgi:hypothetical protein